MNRTIKFRVWNKRTNSWVHGPNEISSLDGVNLFGETILLGGFMDGIGIEELNDCIALQYTGLEDKNGKGIFEGDILSIATWDSKYKNIEVKWQQWGAFNLCGFTEYGPAEVIGNVFENPEIIKYESI